MNRLKSFPITKSDVEHIAKLAQLTLTGKEKDTFQKQLSEILNYIDQLNELNTTKTKATSQVTGLENVFREDETTPSLTPEEVLSAAKDSVNNFFKIGAVFEER